MSELGKIQIKALNVDTRASYRLLRLTDGFSERECVAFGDWTAAWTIGGVYDVNWTKTEKGWRVDDPNKRQSQGERTHSSATPAQQQTQPAVSAGLSKDEKIAYAFIVASNLVAGSGIVDDKLKNLARQAYTAMFSPAAAQSPTPPRPPVAQPAAPVALVVPPTPPVAPTPEPTLPIDFESADFEEDPDMPF